MTASLEIVRHLPSSIAEDPAVQERLHELILALENARRRVGGSIQVILTHEKPTESLHAAHHVRHDCSPSAWYEYQDQMSHGGNGRGGNWNDDDRVL